MTSPQHFSFSAIGTGWEIVTDDPLRLRVREQLAALIDRFDRTCSRFRPDSLVTAMARTPAGGTFEFPPDVVPLFELYDELYAATEGAVDPLVGRDLELLGYDARYTLSALPKERRVAERVDRPRWVVDVRRDGRVLHTRRPVVVDLGAAGKGYLVDRVTELLSAAGIHRCTVDAGGDLRHTGPETLRVGLEHPARPGQVIGVVAVRDQALCASATNRRAWGDGLHHVVDPGTGEPVGGVVATWAMADTALLADGLATALFFSPGPSLHRFRFSWVRMMADHTVQASPDLRPHLFT